MNCRFHKGILNCCFLLDIRELVEKVERINREEILADYDRKVVVEDGKLCTILTYKGVKNLMNEREELIERKERTILDNPPSEETKLKMFFYERAPLMDAPFGWLHFG